MRSHPAELNYIFYHLIYVVLLPLFFGCSTISHYPNHPLNSAQMIAKRPLSQQDRLQLALLARQALGKSQLKVGPKHFRSDCSGTIRAIFAQARIGLGGIIKNHRENDVKAIYRYVQKYGKIHKDNPVPGDLVFFHNTYDRSRNGQMNDALTHVGVVETVDKSTIHFIHHLGKTIIRSRMDLSYPKETFHPVSKVRINHVLRKAQGQHRAYTAAELFAGFGRL